MVKKRIVILLVGVVGVVGVAGFLVYPVQHGQRVYSPSGRHYAVVTASNYHSFLPGMPGQGSDRPGYLTVYTAAHRSCGSVSVPMVWMISDIKWKANSAWLPLKGEWDLQSCTLKTK